MVKKIMKTMTMQIKCSEHGPSVIWEMLRAMFWSPKVFREMLQSWIHDWIHDWIKMS